MKTLTHYSQQEFHQLLDENEIPGESRNVVDRWIERGDGVAIYENADLGHPELGHLKFVSFGSPAAQLEVRHAADLPGRLPDIGSEINWRYVLKGVFDRTVSRS